MRIPKTIAGILCIAMLATGGSAQQAPPAAVQTEVPAAVVLPPPEPVLQHIPADALGFVVVKDVAGLMGKVDTYLETVGLRGMLPMPPDSGVLDMIKASAMLGEGFNPSGGFALVMLDPNAYDVDLIGMMKRGGPTSRPDGTEETIPLVLLVPGTSVEGVFGSYPLTQVGRCTEVDLRMGKMFAMQVGGYVALSPGEQYLQAVTAVPSPAAMSLSAKQLDLIAKSDISATVNMAKASPLLRKMMAMSQKQMATGGAPPFMVNLVSAYMDLFDELLPQVSGYSFGLRFGQTGLVIEELAEFVPTSDLGQAMLATKPSQEPLLNRLPNRQYILALGGVSQPMDEPAKAMMVDLLDKALAEGTPLDEQTTQDVKTMITDWMDQVTGLQLVGGGAPEGSGLFAISCVLTCKDSARLADMLAKMPDLAKRVILAIAEEKELPAEITVTRQADNVEGASVDVIEIAPPADVVLDEDEKAKMATALGEAHIRIYVATVDEHMVVVTFGGAKPFLAEAIRTAKAGSGTILADPATAAAMKELPANPAGIVLLNVGNGVEVLVNAMTVMEGPQAAPQIPITAKTPIAIASAVEGAAARGVYYIPNDVVAECIQAIGGLFMMHRQMPPTSGPSGDQDF